MLEIQQIIITALVAAGGAFFIKLLKIPGATIIGSILFTGIYSVLTENAYMTTEIKVFAQIIAGTYIGSIASREDIRHLPQVFKPFLLVMFAFLGVNLVSGFLIYYYSPLDLTTALLCTMPGGVSDTVIIALDMDADVTKVAVMQLIRLFFGIGMLPVIIKTADKYVPHTDDVKEYEIKDRTHTHKEPIKSDRKTVIITTLIVSIAGILGKLSGVAAGVMLFSMAAMLVIRLKLFEFIRPPMKLRNFGLILIGACIGANISRSEVAALPEVIGPIFIMVLSYCFICFVFGSILHVKFGMALREGMLCLSPAGATEMVVIAADMGIESTSLAVIQIGRLITVMIICPQLIAFLATIFV